MSSHHHHDPHSSRLALLLDRVGTALGAVCAVHCAITPIALTVAPLLGLSALWSPEGETILLTCAFVLTLPSWFIALQQWYSAPSQIDRRNARQIFLAFAGAWFILIGAMVVSHHHLDENDAVVSHISVAQAHAESPISRHSHHEHALQGLPPSSPLTVVETPSDDDHDNHDTDHGHSTAEVSLSALGGLGLAFAHFLSLKRRRDDDVEHLNGSDSSHCCQTTHKI